MRHTQFTSSVSALAGIVLATLLGLEPVTAAFAQGGPPPGGFGGGPGVPPPDGFGGGPGVPPPDGFGGGQDDVPPLQTSFVTGTVSAVDANTGTFTLKTQARAAQLINTDSNSRIVQQTTVSVSALKVGDKIEVRGAPTGIRASMLMVGTPPAGLSGPANTDVGFAGANGTVKTLPTKADPHLVLSLGTDVVLTVTVAANAKVVKYTAAQVSDLKTGEPVMAVGQMGTDGGLTATVVGINFPSTTARIRTP